MPFDRTDTADFGRPTALLEEDLVATAAATGGECTILMKVLSAASGIGSLGWCQASVYKTGGEEGVLIHMPAQKRTQL